MKILQEIESRHGQSEQQMTFLLKSLQSMPTKSGKVLHLKLPQAPLLGEKLKTNESQVSLSRSTGKRLSLDNTPSWLKDSTKELSLATSQVIIDILL